MNTFWLPALLVQGQARIILQNIPIMPDSPPIQMKILTVSSPIIFKHSGKNMEEDAKVIYGIAAPLNTANTAYKTKWSPRPPWSGGRIPPCNTG